MRVLGIVPNTTRFGFPLKNGSATLLDGDKLIVSIPEERITRVKASAGCREGAHYILESILKDEAPDKVVISTCCEHAEDAYSDELGNTLFIQNRILRSPSHHFSHALMAYYLSPFEKALIMVIDAGGNTYGNNKHQRWWALSREQATFYKAEGNKIELVYSCFTEPLEWGIGESYRAFTKYLGFGGQTNSGKTMGLAAFGSLTNINFHLFDLLPEGQIRSNLKCETPWQVEGGVKQFLEMNGIHANKRQPDDLLLPIHAIIAGIIQSETENAIVHAVKYLFNKYGIRNLCFAGGVALNIPTNTKIIEIPGIDGFFIPPCPGDDGQSIGNALLPLFNLSQKEKPLIKWPQAFLGIDQRYSSKDIFQDVEASNGEFEVLDDDDKYNGASDLISKGHILGWFHGRSEVGPRALGHRSILADPRRLDVRRRISLWIKGRDPFRPYAASILIEDLNEWFELNRDNPFMLFLGKMKENARLSAPALFHPDNCCRIHTVDHTVSELRELLITFKNKTGLPFVLNTSLNLLGKPIAETPKDALDVLRGSDLDGLVIGSKIIMKRRRSIPSFFVKIPEISFKYGDDEVEAKIRLLYPGMPISRRNYFGLVHEYCDWILLGRKTTTIRYADHSIDLPADRFLQVVARPGGEVVYSVEIKRIRVLPFGSLSHQDALRDGFYSLNELKDALDTFYGRIPEISPVTIYEIEVMPGFDGVRERALVSPYTSK